jgi:hypothetical protein
MERALAQLPQGRFGPRSQLAPVGLGLAMSGAGPDRRIALALCDAQAARRFARGRAAERAEEQPQALEEILEMALQRGWNHVFKTLKSQGLLEEQTLGHVVARWAPRERGAETLTDMPRAGLRIAPPPDPSRIG